MDILKRQMAPVTEEAWEEIDEQAKEILENRLTARKFVDVSSPLGWDVASVPEGSLGEIYDKEKGVRYGVRQSRPIIETRISFDLEIWELDNITRGSEDVDLEPLEEAAAKAADFEDMAVYEGVSKAGVAGLIEESEESLPLPSGTTEIVDTVSDAVRKFKESSIEGPYGIVVNSDLWSKINHFVQGYPVGKKITDILEGPMIYNPSLDTPLIVSLRGGDFDLSLGRDFSIGYENHDNEKVSLFITESFTFKILDPAAVITME